MVRYRQIYVGLFSKPGTNEYEIHRTIILMSHAENLPSEFWKLNKNSEISLKKPERNSIGMLKINTEEAIQIKNMHNYFYMFYFLFVLNFFMFYIFFIFFYVLFLYVL